MLISFFHDNDARFVPIYHTVTHLRQIYWSLSNFTLGWLPKRAGCLEQMAMISAGLQTVYFFYADSGGMFLFEEVECDTTNNNPDIQNALELPAVAWYHDVESNMNN